MASQKRVHVIFCILHCHHHPPVFVVGEQVSFVQYSDDAKTEFKLNTYHDKGIVLSALQSVRYRGGNTKTGAPLRTKESVGNFLM